MISPEFTPCESAQILEAMVKGVAWSFPMEFTLRYSGFVAHSLEGAHQVRCDFNAQLSDYWSRDLRLKDIKATDIQHEKQSQRFRSDVRMQELNERVGPLPADKYAYHEVGGIKFVPLVTQWRYLRCELSLRIHRYEGDLHTGGLIEHNGDLDNKCKTLIDGLTMPFKRANLPRVIPAFSAPVCYCVLQDDRLVTKITMETRNILGPRPPKRQLSDIQADIDIKIYPIHLVGNINYEMLIP